MDLDIKTAIKINRSKLNDIRTFLLRMENDLQEQDLDKYLAAAIGIEVMLHFISCEDGYVASCNEFLSQLSKMNANAQDLH